MSEQLPHNFFEGDGLPLDDRLDGPWVSKFLKTIYHTVLTSAAVHNCSVESIDEGGESLRYLRGTA